MYHDYAGICNNYSVHIPATSWSEYLQASLTALPPEAWGCPALRVVHPQENDSSEVALTVFTEAVINSY